VAANRAAAAGMPSSRAIPWRGTSSGCVLVATEAPGRNGAVQVNTGTLECEVCALQWAWEQNVPRS
jgi:hypothetical protein